MHAPLYLYLQMFDLYQKVQSTDKRIVIVSDMYLTGDFVTMLLEKCGITGYERLYVSSEYHKNKKYGDLFDIVVNDMGCSASEIIHIGDNPFGDYFVPKAKGLKAFLYRKF